MQVFRGVDRFVDHFSAAGLRKASQRLRVPGEDAGGPGFGAEGEVQSLADEQAAEADFAGWDGDGGELAEMPEAGEFAGVVAVGLAFHVLPGPADAGTVGNVTDQ